MKSILLFIPVALFEVIPLTILYEKMEDSYTHVLNTILIQEATREYNNLLKDSGLEIRLDAFQDYSQYSKTPEYAELAYMAGLDDIEGRIVALENFPTNIIMLVGFIDPTGPENYSDINPCRSRFFVNIKENNEVVHTVLDGLRQWVSAMINIELPDIFMLADNSSIVKRIDAGSLKEELQRCQKAMDSSREQVESPGRIKGKYFSGRDNGIITNPYRSSQSDSYPYISNSKRSNNVYMREKTTPNSSLFYRFSPERDDHKNSPWLLNSNSEPKNISLNKNQKSEQTDIKTLNGKDGIRKPVKPSFSRKPSFYAPNYGENPFMHRFSNTQTR